MKTSSLLLLLLLSLPAFHCRKNSCFSHAGSRVKVQRPTESFHQVDLYNHINLVLTQDTAESIFVEAGSNLLPNITTTVEKGVLSIRNAASCQWLRDPGETIHVYLTVKALDRLNYSGSGRVTSTNAIEAPQLEISSREGAGDIELSVKTGVVLAYIHTDNAGIILHGKSGACDAYTNARGNLDLSDLEVSEMSLTYAGVREATVNVTKMLHARIFHTGNVYYKGRPATVTAQTFSSGKLYPLP